MTNKPLTDEERQLFQDHMEGVKPLKVEQRVNHKPKPGKIKVRRPEQEVPTYNLETSLQPEVTAEDELFFTTQGVQQGTLKQLRKGLIHCEAQLDLHSHTVATAEQALAHFIEQVQQAGLRCVRVIHGKGYAQLNPYPILKNELNRWLRHHPAVLAFCSAKPKHGGTGALYLLIKRKK